MNYGKEWKFIDWLVADLSNVRAYCKACRCFGEYVSKYMEVRAWSLAGCRFILVFRM